MNDTPNSDSSAPAISVVMPARNSVRTIREAIESVLAQTFSDFELLVIDGASTDGTTDLVRTHPDPRVVHLPDTLADGPAAAANQGLEAARGRYVARLDADDIAEPERFAKQVEFLEANPQVTVVGSWTTEIDEEGRAIGAFETFPAPGYLAWEMTYCNPVYHSTAMMRREPVLAIGGYGPWTAEDHDLFLRVVMAGGSIALLPERLVRYRRSSFQLTSTIDMSAHLQGALEVRQRYCEWLLGEPVAPEPIRGIMWLFGWENLVGRPREIEPTLTLLQRIRRAGRERADAESQQAIDGTIRHHLLRNARAFTYQDPGLSSALLRALVEMRLANSNTWWQVAKTGMSRVGLRSGPRSQPL